MPKIDESVFNDNADWTSFYGNVEEANLVTIFAFVDANHASNVVTHCSHSGILIYVQNAPIVWFSK
jgi:hypothetical protein